MNILWPQILWCQFNLCIGGESYLEAVGYDGVNGSIQCSEFDFALQLSGCSCPVRSKVLTVAAPRCKELHQPHVVTAKDQVFKVAVCQLHDILRITTLHAMQSHIISRVLQSLQIPTIWLRHHPLRGVDSVHLQIVSMGTWRQCGSWSVAGHNHGNPHNRRHSRWKLSQELKGK